MDKKIIRNKVKSLRDELSKETLKNNSDIIFEKLKQFLEHKQFENIMLYSSFNNEVSTGQIIEYFLENNYKVYLPFSKKEGNEIIAYEIKNTRKDLVPGVFGILEPNRECCKVLENESLDLIILPGVAFDISGNRMGFGKGYYDRFLAKHSESLTIALAHDFQVFQYIPFEKHDIPLKVIITEKRFIETNTSLNGNN